MKTSSKKTDSINKTNIFSEAVSIVGVLFTSMLSFLITCICSISDYQQISLLIDSTIRADRVFLSIFSFTIVIFLNFSLFIAGTIIKNMVCGKTIGGSKVLSYVTIVSSFILFLVLFAVTFKLKYEFRFALFEVGYVGAADKAANMAAAAVAEAADSAFASKISEDTLIGISAVLSGMMPAFTSILSLLSVFMFHDPIEFEKAMQRAKLIFYKYRLFITEAKREELNGEIAGLCRCLADFGKVLSTDYENFRNYITETVNSEATARIAEYTAAMETNKANQDVVTMLAEQASKCVAECDSAIRAFKMPGDKLPELYSAAIEEAKERLEKENPEEATDSGSAFTRAENNAGNEYKAFVFNGDEKENGGESSEESDASSDINANILTRCS